MSQELVQHITQTQTQQLSTMQVALAGLIALPLTELTERIQDEMVENAALEENAGDTEDDFNDMTDGDDGEIGRAHV